ncbi:MAG: MBL fold metallo-hydrolase [Burkholderiaceae bacterium]
MSEAIDRLPAGVVLIERDWLSSNHIVLFDADQALVVDTGYNTHKDMTCHLIDAALKRNPVGRPAGLMRIFNTHLHSDHCGGNAALVAQHQCPVFVPSPSVAAVNDWHSEHAKHSALGQHCDQFRADGGIEPGEQFDAGGLTWTALAAPGHDPDSLIFFNDSHGILISADALWENGFGVIFPEILGDSGFAEQGAVLDLIDSIKPAVVLPGHGRVFDDVAGAINRARGRLKRYVENPVSSHQNALKVLVKFVLLDRQTITRASLHALTLETPIFQALGKHVQMPPEQAVDWAIAWLVERQQLRIEGDQLFNQMPA